MSQPLMAKPSFVRFNILVVDDDSTSLSIVAAMLKHWDYDVVTVKRPVDALETIRIQQDIDLVVTDLHMPEMNGLELQKQISEEFHNLPVIVMSSDDRQSVIMKSLASGVVFYIVKPVSPDALKNVWQYAVTSKIGKSLFNIEEIGSIEGGSSANKISSDDIFFASSSSLLNEENQFKRSSKRKALKRGNGDHELGGETNNGTAAPKKAKVVWTNSLHNRFLQAIRHITLEKAVPKKILEFMNVPGLTRENVASHLQKYRIFLKRVAEKCTGGASKSFSLRSSFASTHSSMMLQGAHEYASINEKQQQMRSSFFPSGYEGGISALNGTNFGSISCFPSLGASSSNSVSKMGMLGNQANFHHSLFGSTTNPIYQANHGTTFGTGPNGMEANSLSRGGLSGGLRNSTNSNQTSKQKSKSWPDPCDKNIGPLSFKGYSTSGWKPSYTSGLENMGTINNNPFSNYAGIRLGDDGELVGAGPTRLNGYGLSNGTPGLVGNAAFHHLAPGDSSSAFAGGNEQENTSMLPPLSSQKQHGLMNKDNALVIGNTAQPEQFGEGIDFGGLLFDPSDYQSLDQQQVGKGALNSNFGIGSGTHQAQLKLPIKQTPNSGVSGAIPIRDNVPSPWNEPPLEQLLEIEEVLNPEYGSSNARPVNDYYPSLDQNPNQQHDNQSNINSEPNGPHPRENPSALNLSQQCWDDEFINSLFRDHPY